MQIYQLRCKGKISTLSSTHHMFHVLTLSLFQPVESNWKMKVKREGSRRGKTAALQRHSLHHRALLPGWRQWQAEQMSYSHYYINTHPCSHTKHTLCPAGAWARHCSLSCSPEAEAWRRMFWCGRTVSVTDLRQVLCGVPALLKQGQLCVS